MIETSMPQDILKYKTKFLGNFSLREAVFAALGAGAALLTFFSLGFGNTITKIYISAIMAVPFFLFGFIKIYDLPFEKALAIIIYDNFLCPAIRKNEIIFPEYEKYRAGLLEIKTSASLEEEQSSSKKRTKKKSQNSQTKAKKKVKASKEYKAIR